MKLMEMLSRLWDQIEEWFEKIGEDIVDFVKPLAKEIAANGGMVLLNAAHDAVLAAEAVGGSGGDKFKAAQEALIAKVQAEGLPVVLNAINGAIEAAVAKMKSE
jgi:hypothetical protein